MGESTSETPRPDHAAEAYPAHAPRVLLAGPRMVHSKRPRALDARVAGVVHDFNNLLTVILAHVHVLARQVPVDSPAAASVDGISMAANRGAHLSRQLLALARQQVMSPPLVDIDDCLQGAADFLRSVLGQRIALQMELGARAAARLDATSLERVVSNLCFNARDAMPEGGTCRLETYLLSSCVRRTRRGPRRADWIVIRLSDSGCGMSDLVLARAFEPYFTTKGLDQGGGLGLSTCLQIVEEAGGSMEVTTALGEGTALTVYLPSEPNPDR